MGTGVFFQMYLQGKKKVISALMTQNIYFKPVFVKRLEQKIHNTQNVHFKQCEIVGKKIFSEI